MKRRDFLKLMGLASSTTVLSACGMDKKAEKLIPYLVPPDDGTIPGVASYVKTTCLECPAQCGLLVKVREELPVKLEGLPGHPVNQGALCLRGQASLTRLYHPERIRQPLKRGAGGQYQPISWEDVYAQIAAALKDAKAQGRTNVYLAGQTTGTLAALIDTFCETLGIERLPEFEPYAHAALREANRILFGRAEVPHYRIADADFLLTFGADLIETFVSPVSFASQVAQSQQQGAFTWYHVEPHVSLTGLQATERFGIHPGTEGAVLAWLLRRLGSYGDYERRLPEPVLRALPEQSTGEVAESTGLSEEQLESLAHGLATAKQPLLIVGGVSTAHEAGLQAALLAGLIQWLTGMTESVVEFGAASMGERVGDLRDVAHFAERLQRGQIGVCFLSRADLLAHAPGTYALEAQIQQASLRVGLGDFLNPTLRACDLILPLSHPLESWGDAEPRRGIRNLIQPALEPIFETRMEGDILLQILTASTGNAPASDYRTYLTAHLQKRYGEKALEEFIETGFHTEPVPWEHVALNAQGAAQALTGKPLVAAIQRPVVILVPSIRTYDGRSAVLPLVREIPDPLTTITYGEWISVPSDAGWEDKQEVQANLAGKTRTLAVKVQPGLPSDVFTLHYGMVDNAVLRAAGDTGETRAYLEEVRLTPTGATVAIPILSGSPSQHGRGLIPMGNEHPERGHGPGPTSLYPKHEHRNYRWAMAIDLAACTGCSACVAACYIENNVAVVGREEHLKGREMSWIRIEPYYEEDGSAEFLPMMCQQCDNAPCEPVCPVYATYHNPEGLNAQVYNRCVGTRYCSNNCPYKVRRFNWFAHKPLAPREDVPLVNPDVSVRGKGIMEKCTFCVQRIREARDKAKDESREIREGEVIPACAQSCPTQAIVFGNLLDENSRVYQLAHSDRAYRVFEELGTKPAVYYLKKRTEGHEA